MPYKPESGGWMKGAVGVGITILVVAVAGAVARVGTREVINYTQSSPSAIEADLGSALADNPSMSAAFKALKDNYPSEYDRFISGVSEKVRNRASGQELELYSHNFMRSFTISSKKDFRAAPEQDLITVLELHAPLMDSLSQESDFLCAQFSAAGLQPGQRISDQTLEALADVLRSQIKTAAAGRDNPTPRQAPTDADWEQVAVAMLNDGVSEAELNSLANETYSSLPISRQCKLGKALYRAMASLPPDGAARMAAYVLIPD